MDFRCASFSGDFSILIRSLVLCVSACASCFGSILTSILKKTSSVSEFRSAWHFVLKPSRPSLETLSGSNAYNLSLIHISEPTRLGMISYAVFCLKKKKKKKKKNKTHLNRKKKKKNKTTIEKNK